MLSIQYHRFADTSDIFFQKNLEFFYSNLILSHECNNLIIFVFLVINISIHRRVTRQIFDLIIRFESSIHRCIHHLLVTSGMRSTDFLDKNLVKIKKNYSQLLTKNIFVCLTSSHPLPPKFNYFCGLQI